jgi:superfamily II DNA/RNA helicase
LPFGLRFSTADIPAGQKIKDALDNYNLTEKTKEIMRHRKFVDFLPIQKGAFEPIFAGKSFLGRDITGSGKTLAFIIPLLESMRSRKILPRYSREGPVILVVVPTRELALQVLIKLNVKLNRRLRSSSISASQEMRLEFSRCMVESWICPSEFIKVEWTLL